MTGAIAPSLDTTALFTVACAITGVVLFVLGAFKAKFHDKRYLRSGLETLLLGNACAVVAYFIGRAISQWSGLQELVPSSIPTVSCGAATGNR